MIYQRYTETETSPAEYLSTEEAECVLCGDAFDVDDENFPGRDDICCNHTTEQVERWDREQEEDL